LVIRFGIPLLVVWEAVVWQARRSYGCKIMAPEEQLGKYWQSQKIGKLRKG
jgi:hypothetical protein